MSFSSLVLLMLIGAVAAVIGLVCAGRRQTPAISAVQSSPGGRDGHDGRACRFTAAVFSAGDRTTIAAGRPTESHRGRS